MATSLALTCLALFVVGIFLFAIVYGDKIFDAHERWASRRHELNLQKLSVHMAEQAALVTYWRESANIKEGNLIDVKYLPPDWARSVHELKLLAKPNADLPSPPDETDHERVKREIADRKRKLTERYEEVPWRH